MAQDTATANRSDPRADLVYRGERVEVRRGLDPFSGRRSVVKRAIADHAVVGGLQSLRREHEILLRLADVDGVVRVLALDVPNDSLILADSGGTSLAELAVAGRLELVEFLRLAAALARVVGAVHARGVIHKDLNPRNVLRLPDGGVELIDFDLATTYAEEQPDFQPASRIEGTLAYIAPEQTGRMNRALDYRADLYSLGVTFFELLTGRRPFDHPDPLALLHAHLAESPPPPSRLRPDLPPALDALVLRLLAKEADARYQSASGLAHDLEWLRERVEAGAALDDFVPCTHDLPLRLLPPRRLYGRSAESAQLFEAFEHARRGGVRALFIGGHSGAGKTRLVQEAHQPLTAAGGQFVAGKFDQFRREQAFSAPIQALRQLCRHLLAEPAASLALWRATLRDKLAPNAAVLTRLLPELEALVGEVEPVHALGAGEEQVRLQQTLLAFVRAVAGPKQPLLLFLDDLQWADLPSLQFIANLMHYDELRGLLLVGTYRSNELDAVHPLLRTLEDLKRGARPPEHIELRDLDAGHVAELIGETLRRPVGEVAALAQAVHQRTGGNPYYSIEFLAGLKRDGILRADAAGGAWCWDTDAILRLPHTANLLGMLTERLGQQSADTRQALQLAACLGDRVRLETLAHATGVEVEALRRQLEPALEAGILVPLAGARGGDGAVCAFCHDQMQAAALAGLGHAQLQALHLDLARRFASAADPDSLLIAAEHYAEAAPLLSDPVERLRAARLLVRAGRRVKLSAAYASVANFLRLARTLLPDRADTAFERLDIDQGLHEALHMLQQREDADLVFAQIMARQPDPLRVAEMLRLQIFSLLSRQRYAEGAALGFAELRRLGIEVPEDDDAACLAASRREFDKLQRHLAMGALERLPAMAPMNDPVMLAATRVIARMIPSTLYSSPLRATWLVLRAWCDWFEFGFAPETLLTAMNVYVAVDTIDADYGRCAKLVRAAVEIAQQQPDHPEALCSIHGYVAMALHWSEPLETALPRVYPAMDRLLALGELGYVSYALHLPQYLSLECAATLTEALSDIEKSYGFYLRHGFRHRVASSHAYRQFARCLRGHTRSLARFDDDAFDEADFLDAARDNLVARSTYCVYRALAAVIAGGAAQATPYLDLIRQMPAVLTPFYSAALLRFASGADLLRRLEELPADSPAAAPLWRELEGDLYWMAQRAAESPENFAHLHWLLEARQLALKNALWAATGAYERAIREARGHRRPWHHALACEWAGRFHLRNGLAETGRDLIRRAWRSWDSWGAIAKAESLSREFPFAASSTVGESHASSTLSTSSLDMFGILRATQALSSETSIDRLVERVVSVLGALAGASSMLFVLRDAGGGWQLKGGRRDERALTEMPLAEAEAAGILPGSVIRFVIQTREVVVCEDARADSRFSRDPAFDGSSACALMALPVVVKEEVRAVLVLENRLMRGVFSEDHVQSATLIAGQLAISIENAMLYESLERMVAARTRELEDANRRLADLSNTDGLTGLPNRRRFDELLASEWRRAQRRGEPLALAMLDIDFFKKVNDHFGHQGGDDCLRIVAQTVAQQLRREGEMAARYGGEEFGVLMAAATPIDTAAELAERIRAAVDTLALPHPLSPHGHVTVSLGIAAVVPRYGDSPDRLVQMADAALYRAKEGGRNRVEWGTPEP